MRCSSSCLSCSPCDDELQYRRVSIESCNCTWVSSHLCLSLLPCITDTIPQHHAFHWYSIDIYSCLLALPSLISFIDDVTNLILVARVLIRSVSSTIWSITAVLRPHNRRRSWAWLELLRSNRGVESLDLAPNLLRSLVLRSLLSKWVTSDSKV